VVEMIMKSKEFKRVGEGVRSRELIAFQHDKDIMHVEVPSSTSILLTKILLQTTLIWKAT
jgi:hypothetical protein